MTPAVWVLIATMTSGEVLDTVVQYDTWEECRMGRALATAALSPADRAGIRSIECFHTVRPPPQAKTR
jgi:hypothetical protein